MSLRRRLMALTAATLGGLLVFHLLHRQLVGVLPGAGIAPEVVSALERSQADLKQLAQVDPGRGAEYHARFDALQALANRLRIVDDSREALAARQQALVLAAAAVAFVGLGVALAWGARRDARRLERIGDALERLASGSSDIRLRESGSDHIGVVARMIEHASEVVARDRRRLASLQQLAAWQEASRRQAHELRTPLTVARLELGRIEDSLAGQVSLSELARSVGEVRSEIQRLDELVQRFAAFARLPPPDRRRDDAGELLREFAATFADAWPRLALVAPPSPSGGVACFDRAMIRQVLVNLCENSARALAGRPGTVTLTLHPPAPGAALAIDIADDGPGMAPEVRGRAFEPYVTTAGPGQGMGLGLAISRKILLDHGGDLELVDSATGATFRLTLPREGPCLE
jgi:two-component system, NtrC family, nitrogen regulation sensor histidine kinase NtrY